EGFDVPPARVVRSVLAKRVYGDDLLQHEIRLRKCRELAEQLAGPGATALERLLCEKIATSDLHWETMELLAAKQLDPQACLIYQRAADSAAKRHLNAVRTLDRLRRLAPDLAVLVNVGGEARPRLAACTTAEPPSP